MAYVLAPDRVTLTIEDGPTVEVGPLLSWATLVIAGEQFRKYVEAKSPTDGVLALRDLFDLFVREAMPTWEIVDPHGSVPTTAEGMLRLPLAMTMQMVEGWLDTAEEKPTAADKIMPDGPAKDTINLALRRKRVKAA